MVDKTTPHVGFRWLTNLVLSLLFMARVITFQGFYVIAYALGIYLLNIFLLFLSPRFDSSLQDELEVDEESATDQQGLANSANIQNATSNTVASGGILPIKGDEEFRPFIRRMPEFKFWYNAIRALLLSLFCTLFTILDIPVFWPILLMYFLFLFALTMRRQIKHMIKYRYIPFDIGKKAYK